MIASKSAIASVRAPGAADVRVAMLAFLEAR